MANVYTRHRHSGPWWSTTGIEKKPTNKRNKTETAYTKCDQQPAEAARGENPLVRRWWPSESIADHHVRRPVLPACLLLAINPHLTFPLFDAEKPSAPMKKKSKTRFDFPTMCFFSAIDRISLVVLYRVSLLEIYVVDAGQHTVSCLC